MTIVRDPDRKYSRLCAECAQAGFCHEDLFARPAPLVLSPGHYAFALAHSRPRPFVKWKGALLLRDAPSEMLELLSLDQFAIPA
jgi:hypothetical protein